MKYIILTIIFSSFSLASSKNAPLFSMEMKLGDKVSRFKIVQEKKKFFATMLTDSLEKKRELKKADVDYILGKLKSEKSRNEGQCPRQEIQASVVTNGKKSNYGACLGSGTELSKKLAGMADLLATGI